MKSKASFFVFLVLAAGMPVYAANFEVSASLNSLDLVVEKSADGQVHIIKNFDEAYFEYSENISGNTLQYIELVSNAQIGMNISRNGEMTYYNRNIGNAIVMPDKAKVVVQVPDDGILTVVSKNGGVTVNSIDCDLITIRTFNGRINYTGKIEGKDIIFDTIHGDINIVLEKGSEVDVDLQLWYSYIQHTNIDIQGFTGVDEHGNCSGRITNKRGRGLINILTRNGKITWEVR